MRTIDARGLRQLVGGDLELPADLRRTSPAELARVAREVPDLMVRLDAAWTRDHAPEFDLPYEDSHDHAIAHVLGALYRDRGDGALEADELSSDYDA